MCDPAMCAVASELKRQSCRLLALEFSVAVSDDPMLHRSCDADRIAAVSGFIR